MNQSTDLKFIRQAIRLAREGMDDRLGGPFGAIVVKDGQVIGTGQNKVTSASDPTAHAEIVAIRTACEHLQDFQLKDCVIYTSCEPCPMCLGAIYWARPKRIVYACSRQDAANIGFDDHFIYEQLPLPPDKRSIPATQMEREKCLDVFKAWDQLDEKLHY